jgi:hypothetical protein
MFAKTPAFIGLARVPNLSRQVSKYADELTTSYDSVKSEQVSKTFKDVSPKLEFQSRVGNDVNNLEKSGKLAQLSQKLQALSGICDSRFSERLFTEERRAQPIAAEAPAADKESADSAPPSTQGP